MKHFAALPSLLLALACSDPGAPTDQLPDTDEPEVTDSVPVAPGPILVNLGQNLVLSVNQRATVPLIADRSQAGTTTMGAIQIRLSGDWVRVDSITRCGTGWSCTINSPRIAALSATGVTSDTLAFVHITAVTVAFDAKLWPNVEIVGDLLGVEIPDRILTRVLTVEIRP